MEYKTTEPHLIKGILQTEDLYQYLLETSVYPREPKPLKEIREVTANHPWHYLGTSPDAGQLMAMLLKLVNAKKTIELGVFTGYSLLLTALSIPDDGKITAIDVNRQSYEIGLPIIRKAGVEHKVNFIESKALPVLDKLLEDVSINLFLDKLYQLLGLSREIDETGEGRGIIAYDNTLWYGTVSKPEEMVPEDLKYYREIIIKVNKSLTADSRVMISMLR
ncbi:hypothetical protein C3L33_19353, partial [Rhododendron williamsianum]